MYINIFGSTGIIGSKSLEIINDYFPYLKIDLLLIILSIIFLSFLGDIIESYFKRKIHIKDSSKFLPGHGGFFDRLDVFIMSSIFLLLFKYYFIWKKKLSIFLVPLEK